MFLIKLLQKCIKQVEHLVQTQELKVTRALEHLMLELLIRRTTTML